jgi:hypothetical protein
VPVTRRCPRCSEWHAVLRPCPPRAIDLTVWVAGTLRDQREADGAEARAITRFRPGHQPAV